MGIGGGRGVAVGAGVAVGGGVAVAVTTITTAVGVAAGVDVVVGGGVGVAVTTTMTGVSAGNTSSKLPSQAVARSNRRAREMKNFHGPLRRPMRVLQVTLLDRFIFHLDSRAQQLLPVS